MIREVGASLGRTVLDGVGRVISRLQEHRSLSADLLESDDAYLAVFDAPGAEATDIAVRFEDGTLFVHIDRFREFHDGYEIVFPGRGLSLDGSVALSPDASVDADRAEATVTQNGTLEVLIPKRDVGDETDDENGASIPAEDERDDGGDEASEQTGNASNATS
ncbi:MAG: Hsp20/alpha crystallin family protein [Halobacteriota archaeon]|uniref:Hsp20/alpha crystallin family protein n=1 Tax=Natronomonas sp. TaxID=2184060 RepID=UPI003974C436